MSGPEKFEDIIHDQFSVRERETHSSAEEFPFLDPDSPVGLLAAQLQLDKQHGDVSSIVLGQRPEDGGKELIGQAAELTTHRMNTFTTFYRNIQGLLENPDEAPVGSVLSVGGRPWATRYPGDNADSKKRLVWAFHSACMQSLENVDDMEDVDEATRVNLRGLINEIFVLLLMNPSENFQELLER